MNDKRSAYRQRFIVEYLVERKGLLDSCGEQMPMNFEAELGISLLEFSQTSVVRHCFAINDSNDWNRH